MIREIHIENNKDASHIIFDGAWYKPYTKHIGQLFKSLQKEFGRCISKVYVDDADGYTRHKGWCFQKRGQYTDSKEWYLHEVWVMVQWEWEW